MTLNDTAYTPKIKICGLRDTEAALVAARSGADYLGFVFVEGVRRQLQPAQGMMVVRGFRIRGYRRGKPGPKLVGLFRNQPVEVVNNIARVVDLDLVQLNGDEDETYIRKMWKPVIRQVRVKQGATPADVESLVQPHLDAGRIVLLDRHDEKVPGGGGVAFDWASAVGVASRERVLLAGGLTPENVQAAISRLHPWGVDVSTGVETDGVKDHGKIEAFIAAARGEMPKGSR